MAKNFNQAPQDYDQLPLVLTVSQVAQVLNLGRDATYNLIRAGNIHSIRIGHQYRVPKAALMEYLAA